MERYTDGSRFTWLETIRQEKLNGLGLDVYMWGSCNLEYVNHEPVFSDPQKTDFLKLGKLVGGQEVFGRVPKSKYKKGQRVDIVVVKDWLLSRAYLSIRPSSSEVKLTPTHRTSLRDLDVLKVYILDTINSTHEEHIEEHIIETIEGKRIEGLDKK